MAENNQDGKLSQEKLSSTTKGQDFKIPSSKSHVVKEPQRDNQKRPMRKGNDRRPRRGNLDPEFEEKVVEIARVTNVTKGGRRFSFSAYVVIGNKKGRVGLGHGKAKEVPEAIKKAIINAKKHIISVPIIDSRTVPHEQTAKFLSSKVLVKPAPRGTGIIAGGSMRAVVELAGYKDIYTKSFGSRTKANTIKATLKALLLLRTAKQIAEARGLTIEQITK